MKSTILAFYGTVLAIASVQNFDPCPGLLEKSPKPRMLVCGAPYQPKSGSAARNLLERTSGDTLQACAASCRQNLGASGDDHSCQSFVYSESSSYCLLYGRSGKKMGLMPATDDSKFYNIGCFYQPVCFTLTANIPAGSPDARFNGDFANIQPSGGGNSPSMVLTSSLADSSTGLFYVSSGGRLIDVHSGNIAREIADDDMGAHRQLYFTSDTIAMSQNYNPVSCRVDLGGDQLICETVDGGDWYLCNNPNEEQQDQPLVALGSQSTPPSRQFGSCNAGLSFTVVTHS